MLSTTTTPTGDPVPWWMRSFGWPTDPYAPTTPQPSPPTYIPYPMPMGDTLSDVEKKLLLRLLAKHLGIADKLKFTDEESEELWAS